MNINPITAVSSYFKNRKEAKARKRKELVKLRQMYIEKNEKEFYQQGFNKITFPILLIEGSVNDETNDYEFYSYDFTMVEDLSEFAGTGWYLSECMENEHELIDFNGKIWDFKYNDEIKVCVPGSLLKRLELNELKSFVIECINWRNEDEVKDAIQNADSISSVFNVIEKHINSFL